MSSLTEQLLQRIEEASAKARGKKSDAPIKRLELSRSQFDVIVSENNLNAVDEFEVDFEGQKATIAASDALNDNQFVFEFE